MLQDISTSLSLRQYHGNVLRFFLFAICYFSGLALFLLLYNLYLLRLGYREDFIGLLAGLTPLASGLMAIPIGIWSDRIGRKPFLLAAALLLGCAQLGLCLSQHPNVLLAFAFLAGISLSCVYVVHVPFMAENTTPQTRSQAISFGFSTQIFTRMLISLVGGTLPQLCSQVLDLPLDQPEPFRYALLLGVGLTFVSTVPLLGIRPPPRTPP